MRKPNAMGRDNRAYWLGMIASLLMALAGQAEVFPEPYRHYVAVLGILGTALNGFMIQQRPNFTDYVDDATRRRH